MANLRQIHAKWSDQVFHRLFRNVSEYTKEEMLHNMFYIGCELLKTAYDTKGFISVTGNLINSLAVGIYYKGELQFAVTADTERIAAPKRKSLRKGESYPVTKWYDPVEPFLGTKGVPAYKGELGSGHQSGRELAIKKLHELHPWKRDTYALVMVAAMPYADFVQTSHGSDVLTGARDAMPVIVKTMYI